MQILGGRFKRLPIKSLPQMPYRPTKSIVRKSLFDKLSPFHYDSVLDLFSGTGIMGFEAASRGANSITFVEQHGKCIDLLKENSLKFSGPSYTFVRSNVYKYLNNLSKKIKKNYKVFKINSIKKDLISLGANKIDYIEFLNIKNFKRNKNVKNRFRLFIAYYINSIRLIDNI